MHEETVAIVSMKSRISICTCSFYVAQYPSHWRFESAYTFFFVYHCPFTVDNGIRKMKYHNVAENRYECWMVIATLVYYFGLCSCYIFCCGPFEYVSSFFWLVNVNEILVGHMT